MIRAGSKTASGGHLVLLGVTPANLRRLKDGEPILVDCTDLGLPDVHITSMFGQTERHITAELRAGGIDLPGDVAEAYAAHDSSWTACKAVYNGEDHETWDVVGEQYVDRDGAGGYNTTDRLFRELTSTQAHDATAYLGDYPFDASVSATLARCGVAWRTGGRRP